MSEPRLIEAIIRVEGLGKDITEIKTSMHEMSVAITKLAVFEERQVNDRAAISRVVDVQEIHGQRLDRLEIAQPILKLTSKWVQNVVWMVVSAVAAAVLTLVIIGRNSDTTIRSTSTNTTTEVKR